MELNIVNEVAALQRLSVGQLRQRFVDLFGETTKASNRTWLTKRIVWRIQALAEGDLSERVRRCAAELALDADLRLYPPQSKANTTMPPPEPVRFPAPVDHRLPLPGSILTSPYKGQLVAAIRDRLPRADRRLLDLFFQEGCNYAAVARRVGRGPESVRRRYSCLFRRILAAV